MNVVVDTSVWSLALRRRRASKTIEVIELSALVREGRVAVLGCVRQELLSGVADADQFETLRSYLRAFPDVALESEDYEEAASFFTRCRTKGIQGSNTDFLICAVAARRQLGILTTDVDFTHFARVLPIHLHIARASQSG
ncbi:MAG: PIN domain-containing protein [Myxococcales bacterium]|nr:PIN domain-containing protein [Myxococcales bacterium]